MKSMDVVTVVIETYVERREHHAMHIEESARKVDVRDPQRYAVEAPLNIIAFRYYDVVVATLEIDGEVVKTKSDPCNFSEMYYIDAKLMEREEITAFLSNSAGSLNFLLDNMKAHGWKSVVLGRNGSFYALFDNTGFNVVTSTVSTE